MTRPAAQGRAGSGAGRGARFLLVSALAHALVAAAILWAELRSPPTPPEERGVALREGLLAALALPLPPYALSPFLFL